MKSIKLTLTAALATALQISDAQAADKVTALDAQAITPTLVSGGVDWKILGDDNRNATVTVQYREAGTPTWRTGLDLFRLQHEDINAFTGGDAFAQASGFTMNRPLLPYDIPNLFSGSIFNLTPDTEYDVRVSMTDPDGVQGVAEQTVRFRTRKTPVAGAGNGRVFHVYPWNHQGEKIQPAFTGLIAAYYWEGRQADWSTVGPVRVHAGDTILVHAGLYKDTRGHYGDGVEGQTEPTLGTPFDGTYYLVADGTADNPITIKAAGDGEVIFDGDGNAVLFNLMGGDHHHFEGITVRNTDVAFLTGIKNIAGADGFMLTKSKVEDVGRGIRGDWAGARDYYIADNVFIGRNPRTYVMSWSDDWRGLPGFPERITGPNGSEYAVKVYGQGHVVAYNDVRFFHDGIDVATYGAPEADESLLPVSIDIYNNYMNGFGDNCVEADGGARNIRVFENICLNGARGSYSSQTIFGGPAYFFRNVSVASVGMSAKFSITPAGVLHFNNTYVAENHDMAFVSNVHFRNNLFVAHGGLGATNGYVVKTYTNYSSSDYNAFNFADSISNPFGWTSPAFGTDRDYDDNPQARLYKTLRAYSRATGQDAHSVMFDPAEFVSLDMPNDPDRTRIYDTSGYDLRLKAGASVIDKGVNLPNITDDYAGSAPDIGAYEFGQPLPHYGPRE
ncbi:MAG: hypothetical protein H6978_00550 [Gammaproteobacteria bacterium]|nr:hypothetical protein [Gammaproteobacteria bacterium]